MKIIFLCGSLEPGRDGVGDYAKRLAGELVRQGHQTAIVSLNDKFINEELTGTQHSQEIELNVLRLPSIMPWKRRLKRAKEWIDSIHPDWLSLQFVPFSFNDKGLPYGLSRLLADLAKGRRWHIIFHELWVGMQREATIKEIIWGKFQRQIIRRLVKKLKPAVIHTQTKLYQSQLLNIGIESGYLPLFGNIPLFTNDDKNDLIKKENKSTARDVSFILFGGIHADAPVAQLAKEAAVYQNETGIKISLTIIGRCGEEQERWSSIWQSEGLTVKSLGEQEPERISEELGGGTIGISTTPILLIEKSGSVAAMREHKLPVLCVSKAWNVKGSNHLKLTEGIVEYTVGNLQKCLMSDLHSPFGCNLSEISSQFIESLK